MAKTKEQLAQADSLVLRALIREYEEDKARNRRSRCGDTRARYLTHETGLSLAQARGAIDRLEAVGEVVRGRRGDVRFYPPEERAADAKRNAEYQATKARVNGLRDALRSRGFEAHVGSYKDDGSLTLSVESVQRFVELIQVSGARGDWKPSPDEDSDD